jgi:hypothetical protein
MGLNFGPYTLLSAAHDPAQLPLVFIVFAVGHSKSLAADFIFQQIIKPVEKNSPVRMINFHLECFFHPKNSSSEISPAPGMQLRRSTPISWDIKVEIPGAPLSSSRK